MLVCLPSNGNMTYMELHVEEPLCITIAASSLGPIMVLMASFFSFFFFLGKADRSQSRFTRDHVSEEGNMRIVTSNQTNNWFVS